MYNNFQQTDDPNYLINKTTNMVINKDEGGLLEYKSKVSQYTDMKSMHEKYETVHKEISDIKLLLQELLKR